MSKLSSLEEVYFGFRANLPVCGLSFAPIQRLEILGRIVREVAIKEPFNLPVFYWSFARGFEWLQVDSNGRALLVNVPAKDESRGIDISQAEFTAGNSIEPAIAIQRVMACPFDAIFVMENLHEYLCDPRCKALFSRLWDSLTIQEHKRITESGPELNFGNCIKRVIVTGDSINFPLDIRQHHHTYKIELPDRDAIDQEIELLTACLSVANPPVPTRLDAEQRKLLVSNLAGLPLAQIGNLLRKVAKAHGQIGAEAVDMAQSERFRLLSQSKADFVTPPENDIAGLEILMGWVDSILAPSLALRLSSARPELVPETKGMVLVGPPGTGKTLAARAIIKKLGIPGIRLSMGALMNSGLGDSEQNLLEVLRIAEASAPCALFIDELDKSGLDGESSSDGGTTRRMLQALLEFLGKSKEKPVFVICTMNRLDRGIPPEFMRPGRFDEIFIVDLPNQTERAGILRVHLDKRQHTVEIADIDSIAALTEGYSGADLELLINYSWYHAFALLKEQADGGAIAAEDVSITAAHVVYTLKSRNQTPSAQRFRDEIAAIRKIAAHATQASHPDNSVLSNGKESPSAVGGML